MIGNKEWGARISLCRQNKNMTQEVLIGKLGVTAHGYIQVGEGSFP